MEGNPPRTTWDHSSLRTWLNGEFLAGTFSEEERGAVRLTKVIAQRLDATKVSPGNNSEDYLFLLSDPEARTYAAILNESSEENRWWLRSPGSEKNQILVRGLGDSLSSEPASASFGVRPALWIHESVIYSDFR